MLNDAIIFCSSYEQNVLFFFFVIKSKLRADTQERTLNFTTDQYKRTHGESAVMKIEIGRQFRTKCTKCTKIKSKMFK